MATVKDVARRAGVSIATVSNVINHSSKVRDSTRARVLNAAYEVGYLKSMDEQENILLEKKGVIGVVVEEVTEFNTPQILSGITQSAAQRGYDTLIVNLGLVRAAGTLHFDSILCHERSVRAVNLLLSKSVDGVIYVGSQSREIADIARGYTTPIVYAYCFPAEGNAPSVVYDDENVTEELIRHLIENGHKNIGIVAGPEDSIHVRARLKGFQQALFSAGLLFDPQNTLFGDWETPEFGFECAGKLLARGVSAIFCMNDIVAGGVMDYAGRSGIKIPDNLSVVGFDNLESSSACFPKLTTVALPLFEIGVKAARQVVRLINTPGEEQKKAPIIIPCKIIYRDSVARNSSI